MDGLSAGASVIAVISLVVQLGGAAHDLVKFLETMSDAPSEIKRLRDLLGMVFAVSTGVRNVLEGQRRLHGDCVPIEEAIHTALLNCQRTILQVQDLVNKVDTGKADPGRHMVSRSWARLRMTLKKDEVAELETKLGQALQMLNLTLTMNLMVSNTKSTMLLVDRIGERTSASVDVECQLESSSAMSASEASLPANAPQKQRQNDSSLIKDGEVQHLAEYEPSTTWRYTRTITARQSSGWTIAATGLGLLSGQTTRMRIKTSYGDVRSDSEAETTTSRYTIRPTFLLKSLQLVIQRSGNGSTPSMSLYVRRVISATTESKVHKCFRKNDLDTFQRMLADGEITVDCINPNGQGLLNLFYLYNDLTIASFLNQQGYRATALELFSFSWRLQQIIHTSKSRVSSWIRLWTQLHTSSGIWDLKPHTLFGAEYDYEFLYPAQPRSNFNFQIQHALEAVEYFAANLHQTLFPDAEYLGSLLSILAQYWHVPAPKPMLFKKRSLAKMLVVRGADLCFRSWGTALIPPFLQSEPLTILQTMVALANPRKQSHVVSEWFELLESCNVDMRDYISAEMSFNRPVLASLRTWGSEEGKGLIYHPTRHFRLELSHDPTTDRPSVSITNGLTDVNSPASLVLGEFNFSPDLELVFPGSDRSCGRKISDSHMVTDRIGLGSPDDESDPEDESKTADTNGRDQICEQTIFCNLDDLWPFYQGLHTICSDWTLVSGPHVDCAESKKLCALHYCRFNDQRFRRKQAKRAERTVRAQRIKTPSMPGAWVE